MRIACIFTRVSSGEQQQEGFTLRAQGKILREYALRNGFDIVMSFEDVETAKTSGRKRFSEMVKWLKKNRSCRTVIVEKSDRLYRNFREMVAVEDLDIEAHLVKDNQIISKDSKSQAKFIHDINLVVEKSYADSPCKEANKGMRENASQGGFPGHAPFGYRNNKAERTIGVDPVDSIMAAITAHSKHNDQPLEQVTGDRVGVELGELMKMSESCWGQDRPGTRGEGR